MAPVLQPKEMNALFAAERFDEALAAVEAYLGVNPGVPLALRFKGECLMKLGRFDEAVVVWEQLEAIGGKASEGAALSRAVAHHNMRRSTEALAILDQVLSEPTKHAPEMLDMARSLAGLVAGMEPQSPEAANGAAAPSEPTPRS